MRTGRVASPRLSGNDRCRLSHVAQPNQHCPVYTFKPRIRYANPLLLPPQLYSIRVPRGVSSVPAPIYVSPQRMQELGREAGGGSGGGLGHTGGRVVPEFAVTFSNFNRQWRRVSGTGAEARWQFQGGDVFFDVRLTLYVATTYRPRANDSCGDRIFAIIMGHELEHIADEIGIATNWLPLRAYRDNLVQRYLGNAEPLLDRTFRHWFRGPAFTDWIKNGLWAGEHNRRAGIRDAPGQYRQLQSQIDALRIRQVNHGDCS